MRNPKSPLFTIAIVAFSIANIQLLSAADAPPPPAPVKAVPPPAATPAPPAAAPAANPIPVPNLVWDSELKEHTATNGEPSANFTFNLTNKAPIEIVINSVQTSCGCTVAKLPAQPWHLAPGSNGQIQVSVNLAGKMGTFTKQVTANTSVGMKQVTVKVTMPPPQPAAKNGQMTEADRLKNQQMAQLDRQAVFRGQCADCHAKPALGKSGAQLFAAVCDVCHASSHRASMVPDLHALKEPTNIDFWRHWIRNGRPGSMMPAFDQAQGGPLTPEQITSLAEYLEQTITRAVVPPTPIPQAKLMTNAAAHPSIIPTREAK